MAVARSPAAARRSVGGVHWAELDGLRALAILLVVGRHSLRPLISEDTYQPVASIAGFDLTTFLMNGWSGVDLFFVLSGFLIGRQAFRASDGLGVFWFKRATRILPAYWTCLACVGLWLTLRHAWPERWADFAFHTVMLQDYTGSVFVPAFWSLGAEEKFYLLAPLFVLVVVRVASRPIQFGVLVMLACLPVMARTAAAWDLSSTVSYAEYFPLYRSPFHLTCESLALGFLIAWASLRCPPPGRPTREAIFWTGAAVASVWMIRRTVLVEIGWDTIVWAPLVIGLAFAAMVFGVISGPGSYSRLLGWHAWKPVAVGSYSLYLTHMMILPGAVILGTLFPFAGTTLTAKWLALLPWYLALSFGSAWLLHTWVERPALVWRDRVLESRRASRVLVPKSASSV